MTIEYYYHPLSPPSCVAWMVLKALGIEWEEKIVDIFIEEQRTEEFAKLNPMKQLPVLKDGDFILTESRSMAIYLCSKFEPADKKNKLYPRDFLEQSKFLELMLRDIDNYQTVTKYLNVELVFDGRATKMVDEFLPNCEKFLREYDGILAKSEYIFGDHLTFLDFACAHTVSTMRMSGFSEWDKYPNVKRWKQALFKLPYFQQCVEESSKTNADMYKLLLEKGREVAFNTFTAQK